ncbi:MAG TPA: tRNA-uridine aminocarboxypropyltransferase [Reyranella sp.]|nr:tRNA-uridine aminocarboxypropyltransferase [Reyranella sp.]
MIEGAPEGPCPCGRPPALCVCPPTPVVDNRVAVLILQHPQEQDRILGTARLLTRSLADARVSVGLSWRNLGHANGNEQRPVDPRQWGVLYLGAGKLGDKTRQLCKDPLIAIDRKGEALADQAAALAGLQGLVALDGNWAQAKALWWRNAWLTRLRRLVVVPDGPSLYGNLRREARTDAVSTLEAVALALSVLQHDTTVRERLLVPFRELVRRAKAAGIRDSKRDRRSRR